MKQRLETQVGALLDWYQLHARDLPWRRTQDPYAIWVSEIMLQQTQVKTVIPFWQRWMNEFPSVIELAGASEERVLKLWEGLGYYRRARLLHAAARVIAERHAGQFPRNVDAIRELPGVGPYTAGAIGSIAFGLPEPILDGNIIRVLCRLEALGGDPKGRVMNEALWCQARRWVEAAGESGRREACSHLNQALMELGATVCTPRSPACERCPLGESCRARKEGNAEAYPELGARVAVEAREFVVAVLERDGRVWLRQRASDVVNGGLWEFPNLEVKSGTRGGEALLRGVLGDGTTEGWKPLSVVRHAITRYRVTQRAFVAGGVGTRSEVPGGGRWCGREQVEALPMSSAHRRIAKAWNLLRDGLHLA